MILIPAYCFAFSRNRPHGVAAIRKHLDETDDVPLQVPVFTDCTASTTLDMVRIMQDRGEARDSMTSSSIPSGKGASMRSKRVRGADEGESDPGWDVGRLASQPSGLRAASSMLFFLAPVLTDTVARVMKAG